MDDHQLLKFNRQILLPWIDVAGQEKLAVSAVTIIGLGGLGCPAAMYLAAAGIGQLNLVDYDKVELTNLQRQLAYRESDIGRDKTEVMAEFVNRLNPSCQVNALQAQFVNSAEFVDLASSQVLVDATDNLGVRRQINQFSLQHKIPLVFAAAIRMEGQISVFDPNDEKSPCLQCVFGGVEVNESCSQSGILGSVVATMGMMQATETIKLLLGIGQPLVGKLQLYDALAGQWQMIKIKKQANCEICGV